MHDLIKRASRGEPSATQTLEQALDRLAWKAGQGEFPSHLDGSNDSSWIDACLELRRDRRFSTQAELVLSHLAPSEIDAAYGRAASAAPTSQAGSWTSGELLARYRAGEHEPVWAQLTSVRALRSVDEHNEAAAVARETMARAVIAIDELARRLAALGYPLRAAARYRPVDSDSLRRLEDSCGGPVPCSMAAFWEVVGGVDLAPDLERPLPGWWPDDVPVEMVDPLVVYPLYGLWGDVDEWDEGGSSQSTDGTVAQYQLDIAPDRYHKMNISGKRAYSVALPDAGADLPILNIDYLDHDPLFIVYLRRAIKAGGFPGVVASAAAKTSWSGIIADLTEGLPSF